MQGVGTCLLKTAIRQPFGNRRAALQARQRPWQLVSRRASVWCVVSGVFCKAAVATLAPVTATTPASCTARCTGKHKGHAPLQCSARPLLFSRADGKGGQCARAGEPLSFHRLREQGRWSVKFRGEPRCCCAHRVRSWCCVQWPRPGSFQPVSWQSPTAAPCRSAFPR